MTDRIFSTERSSLHRSKTPREAGLLPSSAYVCAAEHSAPPPLPDER